MKRSTCSAFSFLLLYHICSVTIAQDILNIRMLGEVHHFVEQSFDVAISGNYAFIASGTFSGLRVIDLSNPAIPVEVGYSVNSDPCPEVEAWMAFKIKISGNYAYVLYFDGTWSFKNFRLYVYDVTDPTAPLQMGHISLPDNCTSLFVKGDYVYVTAYEFGGFSGVIVIDVSDPLQPVEVTYFQTWGMPESIYVTDNITYIANNDSLLIYNVTEPGSPIKLGSYSPESEIAHIHHVAVQGDFIYIIDSVFGVRILDASDFSQIQEVISIPHNQTDAHFSPIEISGDFMYYLQDGDMTGKVLIVLDVSDPTAPVERGSYHMSGNWWFYGFDYYDGYACIAGGSAGLRVVDVSYPESIQQVGCYDPFNLTFGLAISGDYAFLSTISDSENLSIYNVSDPSSPTVMNSLSFGGRPFWISVYENYLYIPGVEVDLVSGVTVLEISNPAEPVEVSFLPCPQEHFGVSLSVENYNNYVYVAMAYGGVQIYDIAQIDQPIALDNWTHWDPMTNQDFAVRNVKISWPYLFVPEETYGLYVLNVSNPNTIVEAAKYPISGKPWWIDLSPDKNYLYLADFTGKLRILDVSNPLAPVEVGLIGENLIHVNHVVASGDSIYVTDSKGIGLHVYNVSDPTVPEEVAYHRTPGISVTDIALANDLIYISDRTHFEIFEINSETPTAVDDNQPASSIPSEYMIHSIYPNPFNESTKIVFDLAEDSHVRLQIYNINGQKVKTLVDGYYLSGRHTNIFQAINLASGTYILRLDTNGQMHSRRLSFIK
ncbi:MAG: T9SS type A sorting domain-containing protein [bacterium]|nr:MAG: T9SS type A sorting domain-containing protein [bacterium]